jgi:hypothetical protein
MSLLWNREGIYKNLKPCPMCKGEAKVLRISTIKHLVKCQICELTLPVHTKYKHQILVSWNLRLGENK